MRNRIDGTRLSSETSEQLGRRYDGIGQMSTTSLSVREKSSGHGLVAYDGIRASRNPWKVAYHEAGHAVASILLRRALKYVTIVPEHGSLGATANGRLCRSGYGEDDRAFHIIEREILILFSGAAAERRYSGRNNRRGAGADFEMARELALRIYEGGRIVEKYLAYQVELAERFIGNPVHWVQVEAVAAALVKHRTLSGRRARTICREADASNFCGHMCGPSSP
jgi:hypothetical protein